MGHVVDVMGIDASTKRTGIAVPTGETCTIVPSTTDVAQRLHEIAGQIAHLVRQFRPHLVVIEGYAFGTPGKLGLVRLGELGGAIRMVLFEQGIPYVEIPPASLKLFASGSGNAPKDHVLAAARAASPRIRNHDEADAFICRAAGLLAYGRDVLKGDPRGRQRVVADMTWPTIRSLARA